MNANLHGTLPYEGHAITMLPNAIPSSEMLDVAADSSYSFSTIFDPPVSPIVPYVSAYTRYESRWPSNRVLCLKCRRESCTGGFNGQEEEQYRCCNTGDESKGL